MLSFWIPIRTRASLCLLHFGVFWWPGAIILFSFDSILGKCIFCDSFVVFKLFVFPTKLEEKKPNEWKTEKHRQCLLALVNVVYPLDDNTNWIIIKFPFYIPWIQTNDERSNDVIRVIWGKSSIWLVASTCEPSFFIFVEQFKVNFQLYAYYMMRRQLSSISRT